MTVNLGNFLKTERDVAIAGAVATLTRSDGLAFLYDAVSAASHTTTTDVDGWWEFPGIADPPAGEWYDVVLEFGQQKRRQSGGIQLMVAEINTPQDFTTTGEWDFTGGTVAIQAQESKTASFTAVKGHYLCDATSGAIVVTLPTAVGFIGDLDVTKTDVSVHTVTIDGAGTETINGALTFVMTAQYTSLTLRSNGTNWMIV